jgi:hypothetical protein
MPKWPQAAKQAPSQGQMGLPQARLPAASTTVTWQYEPPNGVRSSSASVTASPFSAWRSWPLGAPDARSRHLGRRLGALLRRVRGGLRGLTALRPRRRRRAGHRGPRGGPFVRHRNAGGRAEAARARRRVRDGAVDRRGSGASTTRPTFSARTGAQGPAARRPRRFGRADGNLDCGPVPTSENAPSTHSGE